MQDAAPSVPPSSATGTSASSSSPDSETFFHFDGESISEIEEPIKKTNTQKGIPQKFTIDTSNRDDESAEEGQPCIRTQDLPSFKKLNPTAATVQPVTSSKQKKSSHRRIAEQFLQDTEEEDDDEETKKRKNIDEEKKDTN